MATQQSIDALADLPGHAIRQLQQVAVGIFQDEAGALNITPVQFALLFTASQQDGLDQRTLGSRIGLDTSTLAAVVDRLEGRGLIERRVLAQDRRVRQIGITADGERLLQQALPAMQRAQARMLAPLREAERPKFMAMMKRIVEQNSAYSRAAKD